MDKKSKISKEEGHMGATGNQTTFKSPLLVEQYRMYLNPPATQL